MRSKKLVCLVLVLFVLSFLRVDVSRSETIRHQDLTWYPCLTVISFPDGRVVSLRAGETYVVHEECMVSRKMDLGYCQTPVKPKQQVNVTIKKSDLIREESSFAAMMVVRPRKVMLNYPPASSVWHLPTGIAQLTAMLRKAGHEVVQRYGHILGLEYVLKQHGGAEIDAALEAVRNPHSDIDALYDARKTFERVSKGIKPEGKFEVARNNVNYNSSYYDGSIWSALEAIKHRERHLWYDYFKEVELPLVRDFKPDLYGISIQDNRQFIQGIVLASMVKNEFPECLVVVGGNFWPRVVHAFEMSEFSRFFDHFDAIVYREGFQPLEQLVATLNPAQASGVVWRQGGHVVVNPATQNLTDFNSLPPPQFDGGARQWCPDFVPAFYTMSNCPMACGFCAISAGSDSFLSKPRSMTPATIAEHMVATGAKRFDFFDETFPIPRQIALGKELKRIGYPATWQCYLTVANELMRPETCTDLYEAGCRAVQLGLETLSPDTLLRECKQWNTPKNYGTILANLKAAGIQTHVFVIVGIPGEPLHWGLKWSAFFEEHGENVLTIKGGRYRLIRHSPESKGGAHNQLIEVLPDLKPLNLNLDFHYRTGSQAKVEGMRDVLEQVCRRHWAYGVTSTIPWWVNRGRHSWDKLREMAKHLRADKNKAEEDVKHLKKMVAKAGTIVKEELGQQVSFQNFDEVAAFARTMK